MRHFLALGVRVKQFGAQRHPIGKVVMPDQHGVVALDAGSQPGQFTDNVTGSGSFVQGASVGEQGGPRGITHIIDVRLEGQGRIKDVGLLRDVVASPGIGP